MRRLRQYSYVFLFLSMLTIGMVFVPPFPGHSLLQPAAYYWLTFTALRYTRAKFGWWLGLGTAFGMVGAIIGELPSGIRGGLGGAILNFNSYYISGPSRLWAAIIASAVVGIGFYVLVTIVESLVLKGRQRVDG